MANQLENIAGLRSILETVNSLPDAGSGGGGGTETATVNIDIWNEGSSTGYIYYTDANGQPACSRGITTSGSDCEFKETLIVKKGLLLMTNNFMNSQILTYMSTTGGVTFLITLGGNQYVFNVQGDGGIKY